MASRPAQIIELQQVNGLCIRSQLCLLRHFVPARTYAHPPHPFRVNKLTMSCTHYNFDLLFPLRSFYLWPFRRLSQRAQTFTCTPNSRIFPLICVPYLIFLARFPFICRIFHLTTRSLAHMQMLFLACPTYGHSVACPNARKPLLARPTHAFFHLYVCPIPYFCPASFLFAKLSTSRLVR